MPVAVIIVVGLVATVLALLLAVVLMPVRVELVVIKQDVWRYQAAWRAFGRFGPRVALSSGKMKEKNPKTKTRSKAKSKRKADLVRLVRAFARFGIGRSTAYQN